MTNQATIVLVASGSAVNEASYTAFKTAVQNALNTFNTNHPNFNVVIDPSSSLSET